MRNKKVIAKVPDCPYDHDKVMELTSNIAKIMLEAKLTPLEALYGLARLCKMFGGGLYGLDYPDRKDDDDVMMEFAGEPSIDKAMILAGRFMEKTYEALCEATKTGQWPGEEFFLPMKVKETLAQLSASPAKS